MNLKRYLMVGTLATTGVTSSVALYFDKYLDKQTLLMTIIPSTIVFGVIASYILYKKFKHYSKEAI